MTSLRESQTLQREECHISLFRVSVPLAPIVASAPLSAASFNFSSLDAAAITLAPMAFPICTAARPVPPAAPSTTRDSPACNLARCFSAWCAVPCATRRLEACAGSKVSGIFNTLAAGTVMAAYRSRAVRDPRGVLDEFGVEVPDGAKVRVWDSTAELRYLVVPRRPAGTDGWAEDKLAQLVSRNSMIGTERDLTARVEGIN